MPHFLTFVSPDAMTHVTIELFQCKLGVRKTTLAFLSYLPDDLHYKQLAYTVVHLDDLHYKHDASNVGHLGGIAPTLIYWAGQLIVSYLSVLPIHSSYDNETTGRTCRYDLWCTNVVPQISERGGGIDATEHHIRVKGQ